MASPRKVAFTEDAARRIAAATRAYERGNRDMPPIRFRTVDDDSDQVSVGHFNGAWAKGETKTLSFEDGAPNYVFATNYLGDIADAGVRRCYLVRIGPDLHLLAAECVPLT